MASLETHIGVFDRVCWRASDSDFIIGTLEDGLTVKGQAAEGVLTPGLAYEFLGARGDDAKYGAFFSFKQAKLQQPHSQAGVVAYLVRYAFGVGPKVAADLWDAFGGDAVKVLRTQPEVAAATTKFLSVERAVVASRQLQEIAKLEDTKIELTILFAGRGFSLKLIDLCVEKWGLFAPLRIKKDPFCLLFAEMPSCGWDRCDRLYRDLGLRLTKLSRQMVAMWHAVKSDNSGSTWYDVGDVELKVSEHVSGAALKLKLALRMGERLGWLKSRVDGDGKLWIAEAEKAASEMGLARKVAELLREDDQIENHALPPQ